MEALHPEADGRDLALLDTAGLLTSKASQLHAALSVCLSNCLPVCCLPLLAHAAWCPLSWDITKRKICSQDAHVLPAGPLQTLLAHCMLLSDAELQHMAKTGAAIATCPLSNFFFADSLLR